MNLIEGLYYGVLLQIKEKMSGSIFWVARE